MIDGWPSTHILKPESWDHPTSIYDEEFGARFARAAGLASFPTWIEEFQGVPAVVIERYDRSPDAPQGRIHQEDFNQVLGARQPEVPEVRRQGQPSAHLLSLRRRRRQRLAAAPVQAHGGLRRRGQPRHARQEHLTAAPPDGSMTLSPAYDVVPQAQQPNDGEVALADRQASTVTPPSPWTTS